MRCVLLSSSALLLVVLSSCGYDSLDQGSSTSDSSSTQSTSQSGSKELARFNFPQPTCGDKPTDDQVSWYPVFIDGGNVETIRSQYCADAFPATRKDTGAASVQVASFTSREKASEFAQAINGSVGKPNTPEPEVTATPISRKEKFREVFYAELDRLTGQFDVKRKSALLTMQNWETQGTVDLGIDLTCDLSTEFNGDPMAAAQSAYEANEYMVPLDQLQVSYQAKFAAARVVGCP